jgi:pseudaminic acid cytidylyltransferase
VKVAVIPARGGSKRIPRKNIREFAGRPMIAYAIEAAKKSAIFEHVVVSTDDKEIEAIARQWGAEIPFLRPADLADDYAGTAPVIAHAIAACKAFGWRVEHVCCIYPGVPFIEVDDIKAAYELFLSHPVGYSYPVTEFAAPIQRALRRQPDGRMQMFYPQYEQTRTQDLEPAFHDAGQFYWGSAEAWATEEDVLGHGVGLPIPHWRVVDIDTPDDWLRAELLYAALEK